jgi:hypothetical protein
MILSKFEIPDAQQHERKIIALLKRVQKLVEEEAHPGESD